MSPELSRDGEFAGYAALFDRRDEGGDIIRPGAFAASLMRRGARGVRMLWQHDPARPLGVWLHLREDSRGLFAHGRLALGTRFGREIAELLREGAVDGLSIGFRVRRASRDRVRRVRVLHSIDLWEISLVTFPMQPTARVRHVRARTAFPDHPSTIHPSAEETT